ncbi:hypothetical protein SDC9_53697 [bioreactor metagenome]|uniref:Uncharacterized protein n=1 Tax=bioreactor metagenome TaxID=1076179 RepID=A0A644WUW5_9ZZZZ
MRPRATYKTPISAAHGGMIVPIKSGVSFPRGKETPLNLIGDQAVGIYSNTTVSIILNGSGASNAWGTRAGITMD